MKKLANFYSCYDYKYDAKLREFVRIESSEGYLLSSGKYRQYSESFQCAASPSSAFIYSSICEHIA